METGHMKWMKQNCSGLDVRGGVPGFSPSRRFWGPHLEAPGRTFALSAHNHDAAYTEPRREGKLFGGQGRAARVEIPQGKAVGGGEWALRRDREGGEQAFSSYPERGQLWN